MTHFHRIPTFWPYFLFMLLLTCLAGAAPYMMCMDFTDGFYNTPVRTSACALSFTTRLGQSGALIMYVSALLAVVPSLIYADKAAENRKIAVRVVSKLESQLKGEQAARRHDAAAKTTVELARARRHQKHAKNYPQVAKLIAWFGLVLIFLGTIMQVVETGG